MSLREAKMLADGARVIQSRSPQVAIDKYTTAMDFIAMAFFNKEFKTDEELENLQILCSQYSKQIEKLQVVIRDKELQANKKQQEKQRKIDEKAKKLSSPNTQRKTAKEKETEAIINKTPEAKSLEPTNSGLETLCKSKSETEIATQFDERKEKLDISQRSSSIIEDYFPKNELSNSPETSLAKSNPESLKQKTEETDSGSVSMDQVYSPLEVQRTRALNILSSRNRSHRNSIALWGIKPNFVFDAIYVDPQQPSGINLDSSMFITSKHHSFKYAYMLQQGIKSASFFKWSDVENDSVYYHRLSFSNFKSVITNGFPSFFNFEFLVFAPNIFSFLRNLSNISSSDFVLSLCDKGTWKLGSGGGRSGATFFGSGDMLYFIKAVSEEEVSVLKSFLFEYYKYLSSHTESHIIRFYGLFGVIFESKTQYYLVMKNVFPGNPSLIKRKFDLKGSVRNRKVDDAKFSESSDIVLKDLNFIDRGERIYVTRKRKERIMISLGDDVDFLCKFNLMDYSLLLGIGESEQNDEKSLTPRNESFDRRNDGGIYSGVDNGEKQGEVYYFGIIDILQTYTMKKKLERVFTSVVEGDNKVMSSVDPDLYKKRFLAFFEALIISDIENTDLQLSNIAN